MYNHKLIWLPLIIGGEQRREELNMAIINITVSDRRRSTSNTQKRVVVVCYFFELAVGGRPRTRMLAPHNLLPNLTNIDTQTAKLPLLAVFHSQRACVVGNRRLICTSTVAKIPSLNVGVALLYGTPYVAVFMFWSDSDWHRNSISSIVGKIRYACQNMAR